MTGQQRVPAPPVRADRDNLQQRIAEALHAYLSPDPDLGTDRNADGTCLACSLISEAILEVAQPELDQREAPAPAGWTAPVPLRERFIGELEAHQIEWVDDEAGYLCGCDERGELPHMQWLADALGHQTDVLLAEIVRPLLDQRDAETQRLQRCWTDAAERANRAAEARDADEARHERLVTALRELHKPVPLEPVYAPDVMVCGHCDTGEREGYWPCETARILAAHSAPELQEGDDASR